MFKVISFFKERLTFYKGFLTSRKVNKCSSYCPIMLVVSCVNDQNRFNNLCLYWPADRPSVLPYVVQISEPGFTNSGGAAAVWILNACPHHCLQNQQVLSKPAGLDLLKHVIICPPCTSYDWLTTECGCAIKSSKSLCKLVLNWVLLSHYLW